MTTTYTKDPNSNLDYVVDWAAWLGTDTIASASWQAETGLTVGTTSSTTTTATIWLSGGTAGRSYRVTCRVTTAGGRIDDRTFRVSVQER